MITIGIPFYNDEKYLEYAIQSVLKQTYTNFHLILMDDGSNDGSIEIAKKFERLDDRVKVYSDGLNKKLASRLNEIANLAQTKYLARMDADDIMHPERIEKQLEILEKNQNIDVLGTNVYSIDANNNINGIRMEFDFRNPELKDCKSFIHPSIMGKTNWFKANPYDVKAIRVEDYELWLRTASQSVFKVYTKPLLYYREFGSNYYKKYFKGYYSKKYVAKKLNNSKLYIETYKQLLKGIIYYCFSLFGKEDVLLRKRYLLIEDDKKLKAEEILNNIINI